MSMGPYARMLLRMAMAALLIGAGMNLGTVRAATTHTISSARFGYSFNYPASWTAAPPDLSYDALVRSPDGAANFAAQVNGGIISNTAAQDLSAQLLHQLLLLPRTAKLSTTTSMPAQPGGFAIQAEARGVVNKVHRFAVASGELVR